MIAKTVFIFLIVFLGINPSVVCALDAAKLVKDDVCQECRAFEEGYSKKNQFKELTDALVALARKNKKNPPCVDYYIALSRYKQLKYLEETQSWDEYFSRGNEYRDAVVENAQKALARTGPQDPFGVYARILLWQFHKDQQDAFVDDALADVVLSVSAFARAGADIQVVKEAADALFSREEKVKARQLYKLYVDKITGSEVTAEYLFKTALGFVSAGNTELAEELYDAYLDKISKAWTKEKITPALIEIAKLFVYKDQGVSDPEYAEKIFAKVKEAGGKGAFNEELIYLRAFNLEKMKSFSQAKLFYQDLLKRFPATIHRDLVLLKLGLISAYCLGDAGAGKEYLEELAHAPQVKNRVAQAFYHLGLLSQWGDSLDQAKKYYAAAIEKSAGSYLETEGPAKERLQEIEEARPIEYNLKTFLDAALKDAGILHDKTKLFLRATPSSAKNNQEVIIGSMPYLVQTGCLQAEMQYLWSGSLGAAKPAMQEASFKTTYAQAGTKEVFVVVVSATGVVDGDVDFIEIE